MYEKEILELKDIRQMLQNNELMKKTDFIKDASELIVKEQRGRAGDPKKIQAFLAVMLVTTVRNQGTSRKIVSNTKRCYRRKVIRILMGLVPVKSQNKPVLLKK